MRFDEIGSGLVALLILVSRALHGAETEIPLPSVSLDDRTAAAIDRGLSDLPYLRVDLGVRAVKNPYRPAVK